MKILSFVLTALILFSLMDAKITKGRSSMLDIEPRFSFSTDFDETHFSLGGDLIFNPFKRIGMRVTLAELSFNGGTVFDMNYGLSTVWPKLDVLIYMPARQIQPYIHTGIGLVTSDVTFLILGGGIGVDYSVSKKMAFSFEPGLYFVHTSNGASNSDLWLRLSAGMKFSVLP
jgi:hypothetical protein